MQEVSGIILERCTVSKFGKMTEGLVIPLGCFYKNLKMNY